MSFFGTKSITSSTDKDMELADPPSDSISSIAFSPQADFLAVASWSNEVRMYEVGANGQSQGKAAYQHEGPALSVCWNKDGTKVISGGADKAVRMFDVTTGQASQVAQHEQPVRCVKWIDAPQPIGGILATGSWDRTIKYWDLRTPNPLATYTLPERCYTMDVAFPFLVVGTAERHIQVINLNNPTTLYRDISNPLKWQTRVVSCFPDSKGFAVGSIEGRVAIQYIDEKDASSNFSFRCHRKDPPVGSKDQQVFAVNDITFNLQHGTFATAGSDGTVTFWDKDSRTRLKSFEPAPAPIVSTAFNRLGTIYAYALAYDWSKGHSGMVPNHPNKVMLHAVKDEEVRKRPKQGR